MSVTLSLGVCAELVKARPQGDYLTRLEAAAFIGVSKSCMDHWAVDQLGPPFKKFGKRTFYLLTDVTEWMNGQPSGGQQ